MKIFSKCYEKITRWSHHRHAEYYLALVAFTEALFFPIPPDVMLVSMGLAKPKKAWRYAIITGIFSLLGGLLGYAIGWFFFDWVHPYIQQWGYESTYLTVKNWFHTWGCLAIIGASFTPIPFKVLSISAGALQMPLWGFVLAAILGRGTRFFLVSGLMFTYGEKVAVFLEKYIDKIGYWMIGIPLVLYIVYLIAGG